MTPLTRVRRTLADEAARVCAIDAKAAVPVVARTGRPRRSALQASRAGKRFRRRRLRSMSIVFCRAVRVARRQHWRGGRGREAAGVDAEGADGGESAASDDDEQHSRLGTRHARAEEGKSRWPESLAARRRAVPSQARDVHRSEAGVEGHEATGERRREDGCVEKLCARRDSHGGEARCTLATRT